MNFRPDLAAKVMAGEKTVTRRLPSANPRSPWYRRGCGLAVGRDYAVCPGRGRNAIGRVVVRGIAMMRLGWLSDDEARREGFDCEICFSEAWREINGVYDPKALVWRIEFAPAQLGAGPSSKAKP